MQVYRTGLVRRLYGLTCRSNTVNWTLTTASAASRPMRRPGSTTARREPVRRFCSVAVLATRTASCLIRYVTASACCVRYADHQASSPDRLSSLRWVHHLSATRGATVSLCRRQKRRREDRRLDRQGHRRHRRPTAPRWTVPAKTAVSAALLRTSSAADCASVLIRARSVFSCAPALAYADRISVREYVFYVFSKFKKRLFHVFFEMTCQKNVENIIKVSVCLHT